MPATSSPPTRRYTVDLDRDLRKRARNAADDDERPLSDVVRQLLEEWLEAREQPTVDAPALLPLAPPVPVPVATSIPARPEHGFPEILVTPSGARLPLMPRRPDGPIRVES